MKNDCIVCIGDSITWGYPYGPEYSWVKIVSAALGIEMLNRGINGETAADLLRRFQKDVLDRKPSHVFILVGANDASINVSLASFSQAVQEMYSQAVSCSINVIIGLPIPSAEKWLEFTVEKYRVWLRAFAAEKAVQVIDFGPLLADKSEYFLDEVHPNKAGYQAMAEVIIKIFGQERK